MKKSIIKQTLKSHKGARHFPTGSFGQSAGHIKTLKAAYLFLMLAPMSQVAFVITDKV